MASKSATLFHEGHLWCRPRGDGAFHVGISDHAQESLGEVVYFELPEPGAAVAAGESFGTVESVKVVNDLISPLTGTVLEVSPAVEEDPAVVNRDPYGDGWLLVVSPSADPSSDLMDEEAYEAYLGGEQSG